MELEGEYTSIESVLSKIKIIKDKIQAINAANKELHFNINLTVQTHAHQLPHTLVL